MVCKRAGATGAWVAAVLAVVCVAGCGATQDRHPVYEVSLGADQRLPARKARGDTPSEGMLLAVGASYARRQSQWLFGAAADAAFIQDGASHYYVGGLGGMMFDHSRDKIIHTELVAEFGWHHLRGIGDTGKQSTGHSYYSLLYGGVRGAVTRDMLPNIAVGISGRVRSDLTRPESRISIETCAPMPCDTRRELWRIGGLDATVMLVVRYVGQRPEPE